MQTSGGWDDGALRHTEKKHLINNRLISPALITGELDSPSTPPELPRVGTVGKLCPNPPLKPLRYAFFFFLFFLFFPPALLRGVKAG